MPLLTAEGFLKDANAWDEALAQSLAKQENLQLTALHWTVIHFARAFYKQYNHSPIQRMIVKHLQMENKTANSMLLQTLFPKGPRQICLLAGLPKPARCV